MNELVAYESRLEMMHLLHLDFNKAVRYVVSQPFALHYHSNNKIYRHTPDFLAIYGNGAAEIINVKPRQFIHLERNRRSFSACKDAAIEMGWAYSTRSEIEPIFLRNLKWLSGYRRPPVGLLDYAPKLIKLATDTISIRNSIKEIGGLASIVRPVLFHLLWTGVLEVDLHTRMTDNAILSSSGIRRVS